jgi:Rieske 2Fe-2S family protein
MENKHRQIAPPATLDERIGELAARRPAGFTLPQEFYTDPDIYARDIERIHMRQWLCVGHESRIPEPGDYFVHAVAGESLIVVRGRDSMVRALLNVCRHRGSHVCYEAEGSAKVFVCPYHAWSYELDGSLRSARNADGDIDKSAYGLHRIHARTLSGLIFVCFAEDPPVLDDAEQIVSASLGRYGWANARMAHRATYAVEANWKLAVENYLECYHCGPAHPEFSRHHMTEHMDDETNALREQVRTRARAMGIEVPHVSHWPNPSAADEESSQAFHDAATPGSVSGSENGQGVAPLMGDFSDYDGGFSYVDVGPCSFFLAYPDYGVMYLFIPRDLNQTDMEVIWLVSGEAREGVDYDLDKLIWMWDVTSIADKRIIEHNQKGVSSRFYRPGPYTRIEPLARDFADWYLRRLRS